MGRFLGWQLSKRAFKQPRVIPFHGRLLKCYPDSTSTSAALYFNGLADYWEMKFIKAYLRPGDNFLDIGANTGVYSILAAACVGEVGSIDAFEPMERTALRIEEQAALNQLKNLEVRRSVVSDVTGLVEFGFADNDAMMHMKRGTESGAGTIKSKSIRLDDFKPHKAYALAKMDIEGAEPLALRGATRRLEQNNPPVWLLELAGYSDHYGMSTTEVIAFLREAGYGCALYNAETGMLQDTDEPWKWGAQNVLAIAFAHRPMVEQRLISSRL